MRARRPLPTRWAGLMEDDALAERLGANAAVCVADMRWDAVVRRLVIV